MAASGHAELEGRRLGDFAILDRIGDGAFGVVYRARQHLLEREAVIKVLHARHRAQEAVIERFLREARLASRLDHPFAAHIYAFGAEPDGLLWLAMEYVRGTPLDQMLRLRGPLQAAELAALLLRLGEVIQAAHDQGIVHRDIKPANVMVLSRAGRLSPKLLDFGVAKLAADEAREAAGAQPEGDSRLTRQGTRVGSPAYMAPELWSDAARADARSDLYALGVLTYEALTGRLPFQAPSLAALALEHARKPVPKIGAADIDAVLARALAKQPGERWPNVAAFAQSFATAAGIVEALPEMPQLDETLRAHWIAEAPQPLAEAVAALEAARNPHQAADRALRLSRLALRYVGLLALACRSRLPAHREPDSPEVADALRALHQRSPTDEQWTLLARETVRPFARSAEAFPLPELVRAFFDDAGQPRATALDGLIEIISMHERSAAGTTLDKMLAALGQALREIGFVCDYPLVLARQGRIERWSGVRRTPRAAMTIASAVPDAQAALIGRGGQWVLPLHPLIQIGPSSPGASDEVFMLAGAGRRGSRMVAYPQGFEHDDVSSRDWLRESMGAQVVESTRESQEQQPYLGLATFTSAHADLYFGREREAEGFANRLRAEPLLAVVGPSGAGKSSFVHAGVVPLLPPEYQVVSLRPGPSPMANLSARLRRDGLAETPDALREAARSRGQTVVVIIDQLEEVLTLCRAPDEQLQFAAWLAECARSAEEPLRVVLTIRDDFLVRAERLAPLRERLGRSVQILSTPATEDLSRILIEPARRFAYEFEDGELPAQMVREVADKPGALALLSFAAARLWDHRDRQLRLLTRRAYEQLGGVAGALAKHAEATLLAMLPEEQRLVREAFRHLVTADGTRTVIARSDLVTALGAHPRAEAVIEALVGARLLVTGEGEHGALRVELTHEALLSAWPRLAAWRREDAEGARLRDQLRATAKQWDERGRPHGLLWRGEAVAELELWRRRHPGPLPGLEDAFVTAVRRDAARGRRLRRIALGTLIALLAAGLGVLRWQRARAEHTARQARSKLAAEYLDRGRQALLRSTAGPALAYLLEAQQMGADGPTARFLFARAAAPFRALRATLRGHSDPVWFVGFHPDGRRILTTSVDGTARLWDTAGHLLATLVGHKDPIQIAAISADGSRIVTGANDATARLWDGSGKLIKVLEGHKEGILDIVFSPDGRTIVSSSADGTARLWNAADGAARGALRGHKSRVRRSAFSPDGTRVVTAGYDKVATIWNAQTLAKVCSVNEEGVVTSAAFGADGMQILTTSRNATLWDARTCAKLRTLAGHRDFLFGGAFAPDGKTIVTFSRDKTARLWDAKTGAERAVLAEPTGPVGLAVFSPDGRRVATASSSGVARSWETASGALLATFEGHRGPLHFVAWSRDGALVATSSDDRTARVWDATDQQLEKSLALAVHPNWIALAPDGATVATADPDGKARIVELASQRVRTTLEGHSTAVNAVAFSPDGKTLASASADRTGRLWDLAAGRSRATLEGHEGGLNAIDFSPDGRFVATGSEDKTARIWDAHDGRSLITLRDHVDAVSGVGFDREGKLLASASFDTTLTLWEYGSWKKLREIGRNPTSVTGVAFLPGGGRLVAPLEDGAAWVWDTQTRAHVGTLGGHVGEVLHAAVSADGALIATSGHDGDVRLWDSATYEPLAILAGHTGGAEGSVFFGDVLLTYDGEGVVRLWDVSREQRHVAALAAWMRCRVGWVLQDGQPAQRELDPAACTPADGEKVTAWTGR